MQSHTLEMGKLGSVVDSQAISSLVGSCPTLNVKMRTVDVLCLLDTGSMVTTLTESYFNCYFSDLSKGGLHDCAWLVFKAANGMGIPCVGYVELDVSLFGDRVREQGKTPVRVAAGTMTMVPVTCPQVSGAVI